MSPEKTGELAKRDLTAEFTGQHPGTCSLPAEYMALLKPGKPRGNASVQAENHRAPSTHPSSSMHD
jgi:hypothetical protein